MTEKIIISNTEKSKISHEYEKYMNWYLKLCYLYQQRASQS